MKLPYRRPKIFPNVEDDGMLIFSPVNNFGREVFQPCGESSDDRNLKIFSVFAGVKSFPFKRIIFQFWRPRTDDGRLLLECGCNPYAISRFNSHLYSLYRPLCMKYQYSIDNPNPKRSPPWVITGGPVATAFLNRFPEVILDFRLLRGSNPLADCGLECDLTCCLMLPIFDGDCVGVVECSMEHPALLLPILSELKRELAREGLSIRGSSPYKAIPGDWEPAKTEIERGLKIACESHDLTLGQVWISCDSDEDDNQMKLVKLSRYYVDVDDPPLLSLRDFYDTFDVISSKKGESALVGRTLETHQPHLCRNTYKLSDNKGVLGLLSANTISKCTCLVICLRSTHTGELEYAFEFFWRRSRNHVILLEALLLTLRKYLPSFKFASGEQLGDELFIVNVDNSSLESLNEASASRGVKRKTISELNWYPLTNVNNPDDDDDVAIFASYGHQNTLFYLPSSSTYENVMEKLNKELELNPTLTYKVEYEEYPGKWSSLGCLDSCRRSIEDLGVIKLRVRADDGWVRADGWYVGWRWKTNGYTDFFKTRSSTNDVRTGYLNGGQRSNSVVVKQERGEE